MGLDIHVVLDGSPCKVHTKFEGSDEEGHYLVYNLPEFEDHALDLEMPWVEPKDKIKYGCYTGTHALHFSCGSYSSYNHWRYWLSTTMLEAPPEVVYNDRSFRDKDFYDLINFADNEGVLGPATCVRLFLAFEKNQQFAAEAEAYYNEMYQKFLFAFSLVAKNQAGFMRFR